MRGVPPGEDLRGLLYEVSAVPTTRSPHPRESIAILPDRSGLARLLGEQLAARGVALLPPDAAPTAPTVLDLRPLDPAPIADQIARAIRLAQARGAVAHGATWVALRDAERDPAAAAIAGLWRVLSAEAPGLGPGVVDTDASADPTRIAEAVLGSPAPLRIRDARLLALRLERAAIGADAPAPDREPIVVELDDALPIASLPPERAGARVAEALSSRARGPRLLCVEADAITGRPRRALSAMVSAALSAVHEGPVLALGPRAGPQRAERVLGIAPLGPATVDAALRLAASTARTRLVALDVDWPVSLAAFPHLAPLASPLARPGPLQLEALVREEASRILRIERIPLRRPLRELGMDSLLGETLRQQLQDRLGAPLPATLLLDHPTVEALARALHARLGGG